MTTSHILLPYSNINASKSNTSPVFGSRRPKKKDNIVIKRTNLHFFVCEIRMSEDCGALFY